MSGAASSFVLSVDGGGSKTLAVVVDSSGRERGRGVAGSSNHESVGIERAVEALHAAIADAIAAAQAQLPVYAAWLGLAGVDHPHDVERLLPRLGGLATTLRITNDAELALGALAWRVGVALIAGTGSIALGRDARGNVVRAGGWGHVFGDEGSGYAIGSQALQATARAADGRGPATTLLDAILTAWELSAPDLLLGHVYQPFDKTAIAALAPLVFAAADVGDQVARRIVARAANELALAASTVARRLDFTADCLPLALGGGLLTRQPLLRDAVLLRLARAWSVESIIVVEPALCAARSLLDESV
jgi:glucosamine kinase